MQLVALLGSWWHAIASIVLGAAGQLLFRRFGMSQGDSGWPRGVSWSWSSEILPAGLGWLVLGALCYLFAVLLWIRVLQRLTLARAYPMLSMGYPLVYLGAIGWLGEAATLERTIGTLLVCLGVLLAIAPSADLAGADLRANERSSGS